MAKSRRFCEGFAVPPCACANLTALDAASAANFRSVFVAHLELDLDVSFEERRLRGSAALSLRRAADAPGRGRAGGAEGADGAEGAQGAEGAAGRATGDVAVVLDVHRGLELASVELRLPRRGGGGAEGEGRSESRALPFEVRDFARFGQALHFSVPASGFAADGAAGAVPEAVIVVRYSTAPNSPATTWLNPAQTDGKRRPYLFTQGQACLNRALFPCMDTPAVRFTYVASLRVPPGFTAVMAAEQRGEEPDGQGRMFRFRMPQPIPAYLVALAVGELTSRAVGPRSRLWSEPSQLEAAVWEFDGVPEKYLAAAEQLYGPYRWETYDLLVMPPSFPFGGMENPRLTFVSPTLLAGDRSLGDVVAHEIAHSWFGNLVTNANWSEFWLNEGFTMFAQRRLTDVVHGRAFTALEATTGRKILVDDVRELGEESSLTKLRCPIEVGVDPEDTYNETPYEKGFAAVSFLKHCVGSEEEFDRWLGRYCDAFAFSSIVAEDMFEFFFDAFPACKEKVDVQLWLHTPGMPHWLPDLSAGEELAAPAEALLAAWRRAAAAAEPSAEADGEGAGAESAALVARGPEVQAWVTYQKLHFLDKLLEIAALRPETLDRLGESYGFLSSGNAEVRLRYSILIIEKELAARYGYIRDFLRCQGKQKYTLPIYRALCKRGASAPACLRLASEAWRETQAALHANVRRAVVKVLAEAGLADAAPEAALEAAP